MVGCNVRAAAAEVLVTSTPTHILKRMGVVTFDTNCHVGIDALPGILQANFFNLYCE